jgi:hypothetical protein
MSAKQSRSAAGDGHCNGALARQGAEAGAMRRHQQKKGFLRRNATVWQRKLSLALAIVASVALANLWMAAAADARVVVDWTSWLEGHGVDVCWPSGDACANNQPTTGGYGFQCVDLPQRLYKAYNWYPGTSFAGISYAYEIADKAASLGFVSHANGSGYVPVPGDMIVESPTASNRAGHVAVVDRSDATHVYAVEQNAASTGRHEYSLSGSTLGKGYGAVSAIVHAPANTRGAQGQTSYVQEHVFGRDRNGVLTQLYWDPRYSWRGWYPLASPIASSPTATSWGPGRMDVFARGASGSLLQAWWNQTGGWHGLTDLGGNITGSPAAVAWASGRLDIFATAPNGDLLHKWYQDPAWHDWEVLPMKLVGSPTVTSFSAGRLDIFGRTSNNQLQHLWYGDGAWHSREIVPGAPASDTGASSWAGSQPQINVFYNLANGHIGQTWWTAPGGWRSIDTGWPVGSAPTSASLAPGRVDVFATDANGNLQQRYYDGEWRGPFAIAANLSGAPAATVMVAG